MDNVINGDLLSVTIEACEELKNDIFKKETMSFSIKNYDVYINTSIVGRVLDFNKNYFSFEAYGDKFVVKTNRVQNKLVREKLKQNRPIECKFVKHIINPISLT